MLGIHKHPTPEPSRKTVPTLVLKYFIRVHNYAPTQAAFLALDSKPK
jgi:hypothetical protein